MIGLPEFGDKVKVWPFPGRRVQDGPRPIDKFGGGRELVEEGREVIWSAFLLDQYRAGDILLHPPPEAAAAEKPGPKAAFDPIRAAADHTKQIEADEAKKAEEK